MSNGDIVFHIKEGVSYRASNSVSTMSLLANTKQEKMINYGTVEHTLAVERTSGKSTMKWLLFLQICTTVFTLLLLGTFSLRMHRARRDDHQPFTNMTPGRPAVKEGLVTLYALDPVAHTFCFGDGQYGETISNWTLYNRCTDVDFSGYYSGNFTVGVEGGRVGTILDLGSAADLQKKYKYQETVADGQGYASIHRMKTTLLILKDSSHNRTYQAMDESVALFRMGKSLASTPARVGHLYAIRITDLYHPTFERLVKMIVIDYQANRSVTLRWELLI